MKPFLKAWLAEAPAVLARELAGELELRPSAQLPQPETAATLAIVPGGPFQGRFLVTADRYALHALLTAAQVTDGSLDADRDREIWSGMVRQVAEQVTRADHAGESAVGPFGGPAGAARLRARTVRDRRAKASTNIGPSHDAGCLSGALQDHFSPRPHRSQRP